MWLTSCRILDSQRYCVSMNCCIACRELLIFFSSRS